MSLAPGQRVLHYRVIEKIGQGGMGVVWKATDTKLGREVALKVLPPDVAGDPERMGRFEREARVLASLSHPNIVTIFSLEHAGELHLLVMECVTGRPLSELITAGGLPYPRVVELSRPVIEAVAAAHERNITHRDLKPANIMVGDDGRVRVLDFGLAKVGADPEVTVREGDTRTLGATEPGAVVGTWSYMSPEQVEGRPADARSDVFSLGILLYELATGQRPFLGDNPARIASAILRDTPRPMGELRGDLPDGLSAAVSRCLEKNRERRFASAIELLDALFAIPEAASAADRHSIAVLPFANLSGDPNEEFFSDGVSEEIINALGTIDGLRVAARTSAFAFKGLAIDAAEIARKLNVNNLLEGSVRKAGNRVRITAQLIDARDGCHVWSERFDRELDDIFAVQDEIASSIAAKFVTPGATGPGSPRVKPPTRDVEAYEAYLRGLHTRHRFAADLSGARAYLERAAQLDPNFAAAWAALADVYATMAFTAAARPHDVMPEARDAAERALRLDPDLADAHGSLGYVNLIYEWDWASAEAGFRRAIELNPNAAQVMHHYGHLYHAFVSRRLDEGLELCARSMDVDPLAGYAKHGYYANLLIAGRMEEAIPPLEREVEQDPSAYHLMRLLALCYAELGNLDQSLTRVEQAVRVSGRHPWALMELGMVHARLGRPDAAEAVHDELVARSRSEYVQGSVLGMIPSWLGRMDEAYAYLEQAYEERDGVLIAIISWPGFRPFRTDPRFAGFTERLGLSPPGGC